MVFMPWLTFEISPGLFYSATVDCVNKNLCGKTRMFAFKYYELSQTFTVLYSTKTVTSVFEH